MNKVYILFVECIYMLIKFRIKCLLTEISIDIVFDSVKPTSSVRYQYVNPWLFLEKGGISRGFPLESNLEQGIIMGQNVRKTCG